MKIKNSIKSEILEIFEVDEIISITLVGSFIDKVIWC